MDEIFAVAQGLHSLKRSLRGQILCLQGLFAGDERFEQPLAAGTELLR
jgi:hypothetical protein